MAASMVAGSPRLAAASSRCPRDPFSRCTIPHVHGAAGDVFAGPTAFSQALLDAADLPRVLARAFAVFESARPRPGLNSAIGFLRCAFSSGRCVSTRT